MNRYYCPFCTSSYRIHKIDTNGVLLCGQCGDPLIRKPIINFKQFFGLVAASSFIAPLLIMIFFVIKDFRDDHLPNNDKTLMSLSFSK